MMLWAYAIVCIGILGGNCHAAALRWHTGVVTTYAQRFEGRHMANTNVFRHRNRTVASRGGTLGSWIELRYGKNGRSIVKLTDRGHLPLHTSRRPQFDVSRKVAQDLGLYSPKYGRSIRWRYVRKVGK